MKIESCSNNMSFKNKSGDVAKLAGASKEHLAGVLSGRSWAGAKSLTYSTRGGDSVSIELAVGANGEVSSKQFNVIQQRAGEIVAHFNITKGIMGTKARAIKGQLEKLPEVLSTLRNPKGFDMVTSTAAHSGRGNVGPYVPYHKFNY